MPIILDGKKARDFYKTRLAERVSKLRARGVVPQLAIIQIGNNKESSIYIEQKKKFGASIGARVEHATFPETVSQGEIAKMIDVLNKDPQFHGIIIQMPVPAHLDRLALLNLIDPEKDVDGLTDQNQKLLEEAAQGNGTPGLVPATAKGVMALLDFYRMNVKDKKAVVMGRSRLVGHPTAELLKVRGAGVTVCHSQTEDVPKIAKTADILIVAVGKPNLVDCEYIGAPSTIVVDVGITNVNGKLRGDVDFDDVEPFVAAISPVPGGVGPMTVLSLFDNLVVSAENLSAHARK